MEHIRGFSLIELLVVIGITLLLAAAAVLYGNDSLSRALARNDRHELIAILARARAEAQAGICTGACGAGAPHGVHLETQNDLLQSATLFQGLSYTTRNTQADVSYTFSRRTYYSGSNEVVFTAPFGTTTPTTFLVGTSTAKVVTIAADGSMTY